MAYLSAYFFGMGQWLDLQLLHLSLLQLFQLLCQIYDERGQLLLHGVYTFKVRGSEN